MQASLFEAEMTGAACPHEHAVAVLHSGTDVLYYRNFLRAAEADHYLKALLDEVSWTQEEISLYGKRHPVPRLTAWYGDLGASYTYSGIRNEPLGWTDTLLELLVRVGDMAGAEFNSVLLNRYRSGADSLSWHSDDEPELGNAPVIASLSLGASRLFAMRSKIEPRESSAIHLEHGSLLLMRGSTQQKFQHSVPKEKKVVGERVNLTFRVIGERTAPAKPLRRPSP
jgi:alkylated DNA repair dioxygenase AlkB